MFNVKIKNLKKKKKNKKFKTIIYVKESNSKVTNTQY